jgi:hypothetical protein
MRMKIFNLSKYLQQNDRKNSPNLMKEIPVNIQEAYRAPNRMDQKRNSSHYIVVKHQIHKTKK